MTDVPKTVCKRVIIQRHGPGLLEGRAAKWYWACSVCGLVYLTQSCANFCCVDEKDRFWLKRLAKPIMSPLGRMVDGMFVSFKEEK